MSFDELEAHIIGRVAAYRVEYRAYVERQVRRTDRTIKPLDADPRVILVPGVGLITAGSTSKAADVTADLYEHTIEVIRSAESVGRYEPVGEDDLFDMEYWSLEQAKLARSEPGPMQGRVVYITGAAQGIGRATARAFAKAGASLFLVDLNPEVGSVAAELGCAYGVLDVCDDEAVQSSFEAMIATYGGVDGVVSNAGTAPQADIGTCTAAQLLASLQINLLAHQSVASRAVTVFRQQAQGGFLLFNASKAALNPGKNFGPYAIAKAGLIALMKQHALEGGPAAIRSSAVNADRIRTALLPEEMVRERAAARGLHVDAYFRSNLLGREVTADDVAQAFLYLALAPSTTGAILTVDGGNIAASVR
ncbi:MAG: NAD(P)-dependent dehydrogenase (short-subunit alcohol dehydrogenase family) [Kiritimatiellia bacterium]|jgi:NAD(P)-dependent dehydrogenase (short-subunit alcohol dehydrogenase family)